jgi:hypothetical protein
LLNRIRSSGSPLRVVDSNVTLMQLFLSPIIAPVLVFVFGATKGLLFLPKLCMEALPVRSWDVV